MLSPTLKKFANTDISSTNNNKITILLQIRVIPKYYQ